MRSVILVALLSVALLASFVILSQKVPRPDFVERRDTAVGALKPIADPARANSRIFLNAVTRAQASGEQGFVEPPRSILRVQGPMRYGDFIWNAEGVPPGPVSVRVDLRTQIMSVFRSGHEIGTTVVLYGADSKETPVGRHSILWKKIDHRSTLYDAPMPYTLRLTDDGVAIHGSDVRWGAATHGCIGVPKEFAEKLYDVVKIGDPVLIVRTSGSTSTAAAG